MSEEDNDADLKYAAHCEQMASTANETDRPLWLSLAAAWRRQQVIPPDSDAPETPKSADDR